VARPTRKRGYQTRPAWIRLGIVAATLIVLYTTMAFTGNTTPKLGLDLQGGTTVTLVPRVTHTKIDSGAVDSAVDVIRQRVDGLGVAESTVVRAGNNIEISVPGKGRQEVLNLVGTTAELRFRIVYPNSAAAGVPTPTTSATPSASSSAKSSATPTPSASAGTTPTPSTSAAPTASATNKAARFGTPARATFVSSTLSAAGASATPTTSTPTASASAATATPSVSASPTAPTTTAGQPPADVLALYASVNCKTYKPDTVKEQAKDWIVACDRDGATKYLLEPAVVVGTDVKSATATIDSGQNSTGQWLIDISFTGKGQTKFTNLTKTATGQTMAIVLDGVVQSAATINETIPGNAQISGTFTQKEATNLADVLKYGALPIAFNPATAQSISASLGSSSLKAGLLAGAIGLLLVIIYCFLYYKGLGFVTVLSLGVSGLLIYACVCLLGDLIGFTLTLAGIAGLIVSVGITADSFVVYFERLKDEVREGKTLRTSVESAWVSARRTILSADTVSLLAAVVLYVTSIGSVRGFAFTLGLSTLIDLFVVFLFTKPIVTLLLRVKFFAQGRFSGLSAESVGAGPMIGRYRAQPPGSTPAPAPGRMTGREA
jgi:preprotein translocase subunit SecD